MIQYLKRPYPSDEPLVAYIKTAFFISLFMDVFLFVFKPFGLGNSHTPNADLWIAGYGLVCFAVLMLAYLPVRFVKSRYVHETDWTTGKELIEITVYIFSIGLGNMVYANFAFDAPMSLLSVIKFQFFTLSVSVFPIAAFLMLNEIRLSKKFEAGAVEMTKTIADRNETAVPGILRLLADNGKDFIELSKDSLLFIEAADNYATVYYVEQGSVLSHTLRTSLKGLDAQINEPEIVRCHRTYIVNLRQVKSISGNAQGYKLWFGYFNQYIPVSRSMSDTIKKSLSVMFNIYY